MVARVHVVAKVTGWRFLGAASAGAVSLCKAGTRLLLSFAVIIHPVVGYLIVADAAGRVEKGWAESRSAASLVPAAQESSLQELDRGPTGDPPRSQPGDSPIVARDQELWNHRAELLEGVENNLRYLQSSEALSAYENFSEVGFSRERVEESLLRFRVLLKESKSAEQLWAGLTEEFALIRSPGSDGRGTVQFTGYFQPVYAASRTRSAHFKFPIYRPPADFERWGSQHPSRRELEGYDGTGGTFEALRGRELAFLSSRWEAFMIHVQGSALLELSDGSKMAVGFAAATNYRFVGISREFLRSRRVAWNNLGVFFGTHPEELNEYLARNNRYIFFRENPTPSPVGSLGVPVISGRSIATDKRRLPPGALGLIRTTLPTSAGDGSIELVRTSRLVLDQDTGSAIRGAGRADVFMGTGVDGQRRANHLFAPGELYYLLLKTS